MNAFITKTLGFVLVFLHLLALATILGFLFLPNFREFAYLTPFVDDFGNRLLSAAIATISYILVFGTLTAVIAIFEQVAQLNERLEKIYASYAQSESKLSNEDNSEQKIEPEID